MNKESGIKCGKMEFFISGFSTKMDCQKTDFFLRTQQQKFARICKNEFEIKSFDEVNALENDVI